MITHLAELGFDEDGCMRIDALHPGVSTSDVQEATPFPLASAAYVAVTDAPTADELERLRALDPDRNYLR